MKEQSKESKKGIVALIICGILTVAIIVACVFFPDEIFGIFQK